MFIEVELLCCGWVFQVEIFQLFQQGFEYPTIIAIIIDVIIDVIMTIVRNWLGYRFIPNIKIFLKFIQLHLYLLLLRIIIISLHLIIHTCLSIILTICTWICMWIYCLQLCGILCRKCWIFIRRYLVVIVIDILLIQELVQLLIITLFLIIFGSCQ